MMCAQYVSISHELSGYHQHSSTVWSINIYIYIYIKRSYIPWDHEIIHDHSWSFMISWHATWGTATPMYHRSSRHHVTVGWLQLHVEKTLISGHLKFRLFNSLHVKVSHVTFTSHYCKNTLVDWLIWGLIVATMIAHGKKTDQPTSIMRWDRGIFHGARVYDSLCVHIADCQWMFVSGLKCRPGSPKGECFGSQAARFPRGGGWFLPSHKRNVISIDHPLFPKPRIMLEYVGAVVVLLEAIKMRQRVAKSKIQFDRFAFSLPGNSGAFRCQGGVWCSRVAVM